MNRFTTLLILLVLLAPSCKKRTADAPGPASTPVLWSRVYGGSNEDEARSAAQTADGHYILAGTTKSNSDDVTGHRGFGDAWVVKLTPAGEKLWARTYGGSGGDVAESVLVMPDGAIVFAGTTSSSNGDISANRGNYDLWVTKLDANGDIRWSRTYGGTASDEGHKIIATADGGFVVAGTSQSTNGDVPGNNGSVNAWAIRLDGDGNIVWSKVFGGSYNDFFYAIAPSGDGGFVFGGSTRSNDGDISGLHNTPTEGFDAWLLKTDGSGNKIWSKVYGGSKSDGAWEVIPNPDGSFLFAGSTDSPDGDISSPRGGVDSWLVKVDAAGTRTWSRVFGGTRSDNAVGMLRDTDGSLILAAATTSNDGDLAARGGTTASDLWITRHDAAGNLLWSGTFGGTFFESPQTLLRTADGALLFAGGTGSNDGIISGARGSTDLWALKVKVP
ncbi:hypothetical protein [Flaviaesturariibacter amylovorans]